MFSPQMIGMAVGGIQAIADNTLGGTKEIRKREKEVDQALQQNLQNRASLQAQSPEANRLAKAAQLQAGRAGAMAQAGNIGAGVATNSGLGGDVNSGQIAGVKAAAPVMQAAGQYDQALAGTYSDMAQEQGSLNNQLAQNTMQRGQLAEMTAYNYQDQTSPIQGLVQNALGAGQMAHGFSHYLGGEDDTLAQGQEPVAPPPPPPMYINKNTGPHIGNNPNHGPFNSPLNYYPDWAKKPTPTPNNIQPPFAP